VAWRARLASRRSRGLRNLQHRTGRLLTRGETGWNPETANHSKTGAGICARASRCVNACEEADSRGSRSIHPLLQRRTNYRAQRSVGLCPPPCNSSSWPTGRDDQASGRTAACFIWPNAREQGVEPRGRKMTHESLLDNPIWHALTTEQAAYAEANGLAKR